jgi:hypothetical protein
MIVCVSERERCVSWHEWMLHLDHSFKLICEPETDFIIFVLPLYKVDHLHASG